MFSWHVLLFRGDSEVFIRMFWLGPRYTVSPLHTGPIPQYFYSARGVEILASVLPRSVRERVPIQQGVSPSHSRGRVALIVLLMVNLLGILCTSGVFNKYLKSPIWHSCGLSGSSRVSTLPLGPIFRGSTGSGGLPVYTIRMVALRKST